MIIIIIKVGCEFHETVIFTNHFLINLRVFNYHLTFKVSFKIRLCQKHTFVIVYIQVIRSRENCYQRRKPSALTLSVHTISTTRNEIKAING